MVTKIKQCYNILKHIPEPDSMDVVRVSETVGCSERLAWMALKKVRNERDEVSKTFIIVEELISDLLYLQWFMTTHCVLNTEMRVSWNRRLKKIRIKLETLQEDFNMDEFGKKRKESS